MLAHGQLISHDPMDYTALCRACHHAFDSMNGSHVTHDLPSFTGPWMIEALRRAQQQKRDSRPWGNMMEISAPKCDFTLKWLEVHDGARTSLQFHRYKYEMLIFVGQGTGFAEIQADVTADPTVDAMLKRVTETCAVIPPLTAHRVTGPLTYLEVSTYDDDTDTIRLADDYGRMK